jgi:butyryl-CoA dehydrogenase
VYSVHVSLCASSIERFGNDDQKKRYLTKLAAGEILGAFALTEPGAGTDAGSQKTVAVKDGDSYVINGSKVFTTNGGQAGVYVAFAMTDPSAGAKGITCFLVEDKTPGFVIGKYIDKMGIRGSGQTECYFKDCRVPAANVMGKEGEGFKIAMGTLDGGRIGVAAQALGIAQACLDEGLKYSKERHQFNKPLSVNQAIQWMLAEMATKVEAARFLTYHAAWLKQNKMPFSKEAAMAKFFASEAAVWCADKAVQIHGGHGYTKDYPVERFYRDAKITTIYEGTNEAQRMVIAGSILR